MKGEKDFWQGMSCNLALKAFLEDYPKSIIGDLATYLPIRDVLWIIYLFSGQIVYVSNKDSIIRRKLKGKVSLETEENFLKWFKGKRIYIPEWQSVGKSYRNSKIYKALKRNNSLWNRRKQCEEYGITMKEIAWIYRHEQVKEKKRLKIKEAEELEKMLAK